MFEILVFEQIVVTILILVDGFLQYTQFNKLSVEEIVTILILVDGFLQFEYPINYTSNEESHNPYFSRWFSAIFNSSRC